MNFGHGLSAASRIVLCLVRTTGRTPSIYRCHSTNVFLNHAQMDPETVQIDFEWARNLESAFGAR
jgi:hypothetical protein